jgi:Fe2+ or Zn2+ uptake regulation protein
MRSRSQERGWFFHANVQMVEQMTLSRSVSVKTAEQSTILILVSHSNIHSQRPINKPSHVNTVWFYRKICICKKMHTILQKYFWSFFYALNYSMLSTIHRRHLLESFEEKMTLSFSELKKKFIETREMNQTTLYRLLEKFESEWLIHRANFGWEKYFTLCWCQKKEEAVKLKCCVHCHTIEEEHFPLPPESLKSETIELLKSCEKCGK